MSLEFEIETDALKRIPMFLNEVQEKALPKANRNALNRSLVTLRKEMVSRTRKHYKLKAGEIRKDYMKSFRASGSMVSSQMATLKISGRPISLIRFLTKSSRRPQNQKGKSIKQRRALRIEVKPGNKRKTKLFVQKGKGGNMQVFRRQTGKKKNNKEVLAKQSAPGLGELYSKVKSIRQQSSLIALRTYRKEFDRQFKFFVDKAMGRL